MDSTQAPIGDSIISDVTSKIGSCKVDCENSSLSYISVTSWTSVDKEIFTNLIHSQRKPAIIKELDIGSCRQKWSTKYLMTNADVKDVTVHVTDTPLMDFINKNFLYRTLSFSELLKRASGMEKSSFFICENELYYLRSLGSNPRSVPANLEIDFPNLSKDFTLPTLFPSEKFFSSVLRVASPGLHLWTHYDIMDNLLVQVFGQKRVILFPPKDLPYLYLKGDKSQIIDVDNPDLEKFPDFVKATRYECILNPGDTLFIPALWFHHVISLDFGVAINVFWKNLDDSLYDKKDPYGNKDLIPAANAVMQVNKAVKGLQQLPQEYKEFYIKCLIEKLKENI